MFQRIGVCCGVTVPSQTAAGAMPHAPMHRAVSNELVIGVVSLALCLCSSPPDHHL
jgi:hypothetical protein